MSRTPPQIHPVYKWILLLSFSAGILTRIFSWQAPKPPCKKVVINDGPEQCLPVCGNNADCADACPASDSPGLCLVSIEDAEEFQEMTLVGGLTPKKKGVCLCL